MDLKFTFQDGSEAIAHYGVKGMKWGVWNEETKDRYASEGRENASSATGGGIDPEDIADEANEYNPNLPGGRENQQALSDNLIQQGIDNVQDMVNTHLLDIQAGQISDGEAQVISVINAASQAMTGTPAINNPKGQPAAYQEKRLETSDDLVMVGDRKDRERAASKWMYKL